MPRIIRIKNGPKKDPQNHFSIRLVKNPLYSVSIVVAYKLDGLFRMNP